MFGNRGQEESVDTFILRFQWDIQVDTSRRQLEESEMEGGTSGLDIHIRALWFNEIPRERSRGTGETQGVAVTHI